MGSEDMEPEKAKPRRREDPITLYKYLREGKQELFKSPRLLSVLEIWLNNSSRLLGGRGGLGSATLPFSEEKSIRKESKTQKGFIFCFVLPSIHK